MHRAAGLLVIGTILVSGGAARSDTGSGIATSIAALPACDAARAHCIGLKLHIPTSPAGVATGDGLIASAAFLATQLAEANRQFAPLDVGFQVTGINTMPPGAAHIASRDERDALADGRLSGQVIHVFITEQLDDVDQPDAIIRGVTWHTPERDRKYVILSTIAPDRVLAHELGHVFGLPHSTYRISIMNKTPRAVPPPEKRRFADKEIAMMRPVLNRLLRDHVIADLAR